MSSSRRNRRLRGVAVTVAGLLVAAGCSGSGDPATTASSPNESSPVASATPATSTPPSPVPTPSAEATTAALDEAGLRALAASDPRVLRRASPTAPILVESRCGRKAGIDAAAAERARAVVVRQCASDPGTAPIYAVAEILPDGTTATEAVNAALRAPDAALFKAGFLGTDLSEKAPVVTTVVDGVVVAGFTGVLSALFEGPDYVPVMASAERSSRAKAVAVVIDGQALCTTVDEC